MTNTSVNTIPKGILQLSMIFLWVFVSFHSEAEDLKKIIDLEGRWKFTVGDDPAWAAVDYDDSDWDDVSVPKTWESEGFDDYNGFAWYRKAFSLHRDLEVETPFLVMGYIDDVDEVYLNGYLIGATGVMPTPMKTAHRLFRKYPLPLELLNTSGKNVIAVRVFDEYREGGIYAGPVGIFYDKDNELLSLNLAGYWDFEAITIEDNTADRFYNQKNDKIYVPGYWESFGYPGFDGVAVYSTSFRLPPSIDQKDLMIVLGYIDDIDEVFINGLLVGTVKDLESGKDRSRYFDQVFRAYPIPEGTLHLDGMNTIGVRVIDSGGLGGIYEGPVGLITSENFELLNRSREQKSNSFWEVFFREFFEWD